jgi:hypothetical protein
LVGSRSAPIGPHPHSRFHRYIKVLDRILQGSRLGAETHGHKESLRSAVTLRSREASRTDRPLAGRTCGRRRGSFVVPREERPARVPYAFFGGNFDNFKSLRQGVIIERPRSPLHFGNEAPIAENIDHPALRRCPRLESEEGAQRREFAGAAQETSDALPPIAAIRVPTSKTSDKPSAISPARNTGGWFKNSANIGSSPQTRCLIV